MPNDVVAVVEEFDRPQGRARSCLVLVPPGKLGDLSPLAARINADIVDLAALAEAEAPEEGTFLGLDAGTIVRLIGRAAHCPRGQTRVVIQNLDLLLAGIPEGERWKVDHFLLKGLLRPPRFVVAALPRRVWERRWFSQDWKDAGRLAAWPSGGTADG